MALTGLDIISLERIKTELRFPSDDNDHDELLKELIRSAASYISVDLSVPLVDIEVYNDISTNERFVVIEDVFAKKLISIRRQGDTLIEGYFPVEVPPEDYTVTAPATDSWIRGRIVVEHDFLPEKQYRVIYKRGIKDVDIIRYQPLIVLQVRSTYNGESMSSPNSAYERMKRPLQNYTSNFGIQEERV